MENRLVQVLIKESLKLHPNDQLVVIYQDNSKYRALKEVIEQEAKRQGIYVHPIPFSKTHISSTKVGQIIEEITQNSPQPRGIALAIERSSETTAFRLELLRRLANKGKAWRIASMPGVTNDLIKHMTIDLRDVKRKSHEVFFALALSQTLIIRTKNPLNGKMEKLTIPTLDNIPMLSTGEISMRSWGNYPSGECFILPTAYQAEGFITINGSIPFKVFDKNEWIRLKISKGKIDLDNIKASSKEVKNSFEKLLFDDDKNQLCPYNNCIAEIGVGTNSGIDKLIGLPIFDEKKLGTFHIGIGSNHQFGGSIKSKYHNDLVVSHNASFSCLNDSYYKEYKLIEDGRYLVLSEFSLIKELDFEKFHIPALLCVNHSVEFGISESYLEVDYKTRKGPVKIKLEIAKNILDALNSFKIYCLGKDKIVLEDLKTEIDNMLPENFDKSLKVLLLIQYFKPKRPKNG